MVNIQGKKENLKLYNDEGVKIYAFNIYEVSEDYEEEYIFEKTYDDNGYQLTYKDSNDYNSKYTRDSDGNEITFEDSNGIKRGFED